MNKKQLSHLEKRLMEERARVMKELGYYDESLVEGRLVSDRPDIVELPQPPRAHPYPPAAPDRVPMLVPQLRGLGPESRPG